MPTLRLTVNSLKSVNDACEKLKAFWQENKYVNITASDKRSLDQNATIRLCYKQIQDHMEGWTAKDVERHCKLIYGVPILRKNPVDDWVFKNTIDKGDMQQRYKMMDCFSITSKMSTEEAKEMINCMLIDFPFIEII